MLINNDDEQAPEQTERHDIGPEVRTLDRLFEHYPAALIEMLPVVCVAGIDPLQGGIDEAVLLFGRALLSQRIVA